MTTVRIDLVGDWAQILRSELMSAGYVVPTGIGYEELCHWAHNLRLRRIAPRPRKALISSEMNVPRDLQAGYDAVVRAMAHGEDLQPYLSTKLLHLDFDDLLLNDWGIYHFHLGTVLMANGFVKRTGPVLLARMTEDVAYLLNVLDHGSWTHQELLRIVHRNWPDSISRFRARATGLEWQPTDDDIRTMRRNGISVMIEVDPGVVYSSPGGGYATSQLSLRVATECDGVVRMLREVEATVRGRAAQFTIEARRQGFDVRDGLFFRLRRRDSSYVVVEEQTDLKLYDLALP